MAVRFLTRQSLLFVGIPLLLLFIGTSSVVLSGGCPGLVGGMGPNLDVVSIECTGPGGNCASIVAAQASLGMYGTCGQNNKHHPINLKGGLIPIRDDDDDDDDDDEEDEPTPDPPGPFTAPRGQPGAQAGNGDDEDVTSGINFDFLGTASLPIGAMETLVVGDTTLGRLTAPLYVSDFVVNEDVVESFAYFNGYTDELTIHSQASSSSFEPTSTSGTGSFGLKEATNTVATFSGEQSYPFGHGILDPGTETFTIYDAMGWTRVYRKYAQKYLLQAVVNVMGTFEEYFYDAQYRLVRIERQDSITYITWSPSTLDRATEQAVVSHSRKQPDGALLPLSDHYNETYGYKVTGQGASAERDLVWFIGPKREVWPDDGDVPSLSAGPQIVQDVARILYGANGYLNSMERWLWREGAALPEQRYTEFFIEYDQPPHMSRPLVSAFTTKSGDRTTFAYVVTAANPDVIQQVTTKDYVQGQLVTEIKSDVDQWGRTPRRRVISHAEPTPGFASASWLETLFEYRQNAPCAIAVRIQHHGEGIGFPYEEYRESMDAGRPVKVWTPNTVGAAMLSEQHEYRDWRRGFGLKRSEFAGGHWVEWEWLDEEPRNSSLVPNDQGLRPTLVQKTTSPTDLDVSGAQQAQTFRQSHYVAGRLSKRINSVGEVEIFHYAPEGWLREFETGIDRDGDGAAEGDTVARHLYERRMGDWALLSQSKRLPSGDVELFRYDVGDTLQDVRSITITPQTAPQASPAQVTEYFVGINGLPLAIRRTHVRFDGQNVQSPQGTSNPHTTRLSNIWHYDDKDRLVHTMQNKLRNHEPGQGDKTDFSNTYIYYKAGSGEVDYVQLDDCVQVSQVLDGLGRQRYLDFDNTCTNEQMSSPTQPQFDGLGRLAAVRRQSRDPNGNLVWDTPTTFRYAAMTSAIEGVVAPDGRHVTLMLDPETFQVLQTTFYGASGRALAASKVVRNSYNLPLASKRIPYVNGQAQPEVTGATIRYDNKVRLQDITNQHGETTTYGWDGPLLTQLTSPTGDQLTIDYNGFYEAIEIERRITNELDGSTRVSRTVNTWEPVLGYIRTQDVFAQGGDSGGDVTEQLVEHMEIDVGPAGDRNTVSANGAWQSYHSGGVSGWSSINGDIYDTTVSYLPNGDREVRTLALNSQRLAEKRHYNSWGELDEQTLWNGITRTFERDPQLRRLTAMVDDLGRLTLTRDVHGRLTSVQKVPHNAALKTLTQTWVPDVEGRMHKTTRQHGTDTTELEVDYDALSRVDQFISRYNGITIAQTQLDRRDINGNMSGRLFGIDRQYGTNSSTTSVTQWTQRLAYANGRLKDVTTSGGVTLNTSYAYQGVRPIQTILNTTSNPGNDYSSTLHLGVSGRIERIVNASAAQIFDDLNYAFEARGFVTDETRAGGSSNMFAWDHRGSPTMLSWRDGASVMNVVYRPDASVERTTLTESGNAQTTAYTQDPTTGAIVAAGGVAMPRQGVRPTSLGNHNVRWDVGGHLEEITDGSGQSVARYVYGPRGETFGRVVPGGNGDGTTLWLSDPLLPKWVRSAELDWDGNGASVQRIYERHNAYPYAVLAQHDGSTTLYPRLGLQHPQGLAGGAPPVGVSDYAYGGWNELRSTSNPGQSDVSTFGQLKESPIPELATDSGYRFKTTVGLLFGPDNQVRNGDFRLPAAGYRADYSGHQAGPRPGQTYTNNKTGEVTMYTGNGNYEVVVPAYEPPPPPPPMSPDDEAWLEDQAGINIIPDFVKDIAAAIDKRYRDMSSPVTSLFAPPVDAAADALYDAWNSGMPIPSWLIDLLRGQAEGLRQGLGVNDVVVLYVGGYAGRVSATARQGVSQGPISLRNCCIPEKKAAQLGGRRLPNVLRLNENDLISPLRDYTNMFVVIAHGAIPDSAIVAAVTRGGQVLYVDPRRLAESIARRMQRAGKDFDAVVLGSCQGAKKGDTLQAFVDALQASGYQGRVFASADDVGLEAITRLGNWFEQFGKDGDWLTQGLRDAYGWREF